MGLGDTLGALPPENGGTGSTTAQGILEKAYPVGSVYMSLNSTNPETLFGGKWAPIRDRFLVGAGGSYAAKATGGEAAHKLTVEELPAHSHEFSIMRFEGHSYTGPATSSGESPRTASTGAAGGGQAHNNMPPYYAVYMWARTA